MFILCCSIALYLHKFEKRRQNYTYFHKPPNFFVSFLHFQPIFPFLSICKPKISHLSLNLWESLCRKGLEHGRDVSDLSHISPIISPVRSNLFACQSKNPHAFQSCTRREGYGRVGGRDYGRDEINGSPLDKGLLAVWWERWVTFSKKCHLLSNKVSLLFNKICLLSKGPKHLFPPLEWNIPRLGTKHSHVGNKKRAVISSRTSRNVVSRETTFLYVLAVFFLGLPEKILRLSGKKGDF